VGASTYYFHQDHLGSTRLTTTPAAGNNFSSNYKPFGPPYGLIGAEVFKYMGQREDGVTGLYAMGARYYSPTVGRFITQDPLLGNPLDPQRLNRYSYARNNPLRYADPHGLWFHEGIVQAVTEFGKAVVALGQTAANIIGPALTAFGSTVTNTATRVASTVRHTVQAVATTVSSAVQTATTVVATSTVNVLS
jgi:RHS repeat-associated protein